MMVTETHRNNLQRMADYIRTIPQKQFTMRYYRKEEEALTKECNSVGCVIGHCIVLDDRPIENLPQIVDLGVLNFHAWSEEFTGLNYLDSHWKWMFAPQWAHTDNTPEGAALRIEWWLGHGLPYNWLRQMTGFDPLCYRKNNPKKQ